jgi:hypothetical protein
MKKIAGIYIIVLICAGVILYYAFVVGTIPFSSSDITVLDGRRRETEISAEAAVPVPDVIEMTPRDAGRALARAGLKPVLVGGDPAPHEDLSYKIQSQSPSAESGDLVPEGSTVVLRVYDSFK